MVCKYCGCSEARACVNEKAEACYWIAEEVCSQCEDEFLKDNLEFKVNPDKKLKLDPLYMY